jgi:hypothetical protein
MCGNSTHIVASLWLPKANVLARQSDNVSLLVHDACSCRAGADVNADVVVLDDLDLVVGVDGHLAGLLPRRLPVWHVALHGGRLCECVEEKRWEVEVGVKRSCNTEVYLKGSVVVSRGVY